MPSQTASGYPYPLGSDRVMDGDNAIQALADAVESKLGTTAAGTVTAVVTNVAFAPVAVTFPVGRFTVPPHVTATPQNIAYIASVTAPTATGTTLYAGTRAGTPSTGNIPLSWIARSA